MACEFATQIDLVGELARHFNTFLHNPLRSSKGDSCEEYAFEPAAAAVAAGEVAA